MAALGADFAGLATPFGTGFGMGVRTAHAAEEAAVHAASTASHAADAAKTAVVEAKVTKDADNLNPKLIQESPQNLIPTQTKSDMTGSQVKRLTKDMKQNGFDQSKPVDAWRNPKTGRLEIQDGHHRTEAAKRAGLDKIPVNVWE